MSLQLRFGSVFSGIGGLDLGLKKAGMTCVFQVEKDSFRRNILKKQFPGTQQFEDVSALAFVSAKRIRQSATCQWIGNGLTAGYTISR